MNRVIKFRAWDDKGKKWLLGYDLGTLGGFSMFGEVMLFGEWSQVLQETDLQEFDTIKLMQFTGLTDKNGVEIYEGDIVEFSDKWEWYRSTYGIKMRFADKKEHTKLKAQYDAEPMERREVKIPDCYQELSTSDLKNYWEIIGNVFENPDLI